MTQRCGVCGDPEREAVDKELRGRCNIAAIGRRLGLSRWAVTWHRDHHLASPEKGETVAVEEVEDGVADSPPVPKKLPEQQTAFLTAYAASCDIKQGLQAAGVTRPTLRKWQEHDSDFALRFHQAEVEAIESLEYEARLRAVAGSKLVRRVYRHGLLYEEVHEWRPSDAMMVKLLQAAKPEKYGERLTVTQTTVVKAVDADAWAAV